MGSIGPSRHLRIGVDVGGTNTDAIVLDLNESHKPNRGVLASHKAPTTRDVTDGIEDAVGSVLAQTGCASEVSCLIIGTTHFLNAVIENDARRLSRVAVIRLSKSYTKDIPPFSDFPPQLAKLLNGYHSYIDGGLHIDGAQEAPVREDQVLEECDKIAAMGIKSVVISGIFSPVDSHFHQEQHVRRIMQQRLPDVDIVCSSEVSNLGLLERENASILNASILSFARRTIKSFRQAMKRLGLQCSLFISQNDGTVIDAAAAAALPIKTFSSGPTNSMRGAAFLGLGDRSEAERQSTIVVDVGGTTTDCGVLLPSGFPRVSSAYVTVAGVTINFPMPAIESIGLGGGSLIREQDGEFKVGPDSVGYELTTKARVFGGDVLTTTDIAVAGGLDIGDRSRVSDVGPETVAGVQTKMKKMLERVIDRLKLTPAPLPVILVGGGSIICPTELEGVSEVIVPNFHSVANAVGAAISRVCGTVDSIYSTDDGTVSELLEDAKVKAIEKAVLAGAEPSTVTVVEIDTIPVTYVAGQIRIVVKAVGDLSVAFVAKVQSQTDEEAAVTVEETLKADASDTVNEVARLDFDTYKPRVVRNAKGVPEWWVSETDLEWIRDGCYILGCAGGGSPKSEYLKLRDQLRAGHHVRVIDNSSLDKDAVIYCKYTTLAPFSRLTSHRGRHDGLAGSVQRATELW